MSWRRVSASLASAATAAGKYDGSAPMLCAVTAVSECTADGKCERSAPQAGNNLPTFMRVDVKGRVLRADDGSGRKTEIKASSVVDGPAHAPGHRERQGLEHGDQLGGGTVGRLGRRGATAFALFGACTLP